MASRVMGLRRAPLVRLPKLDALACLNICLGNGEPEPERDEVKRDGVRTGVERASRERSKERSSGVPDRERVRGDEFATGAKEAPVRMSPLSSLMSARRVWLSRLLTDTSECPIDRLAGSRESSERMERKESSKGASSFLS